VKNLYRKTSIVLLTIIFTINSAACAEKKEYRYEAEYLQLFDTLTTIVAYSDSKEEFTKQSQFIYEHLKQYHELFDIYNNYEGINNIKTINDNAGIAPVKVDKKIIDLIRFGELWYKKTDGKVNIAYGAVLKIWSHFRTEGTADPEKAQLPPINQLKAAAEHTDISKLVIDEAESTVFLQDPEMSLDVGAIGKGYAVEQVSQMAKNNGFISGIINVGGNVRAIGSRGESGSPWSVGIQNPNKENDENNGSELEQSELQTINLTDLSMVTSGDYERFYIVNGKNYHHIIDPETLYPADYFTAVTIISNDSGLADMLSTAVFNMPFVQGKKLIENLPDTEALWIFKDEKIEYSSCFKNFIKNDSAVKY